MLFKETRDRLVPIVDEALDELFEIVVKNQTHEQDLLLIEINGFYLEEFNTPEFQKKWPNQSPFVFGPGGWIYETDHTQYRFYDFYRRQVQSIDRSAFFDDYNKNSEKKELYDLTLQIELMVYLKFWESDSILKKLYQLSNLALGKNYNWLFDIKQKDSRKEVIINKIRNPIERLCPKYFKLLKDIYLSQIRNAAAHSDFYIVGQKLGFKNVDIKNHAPLGQIDFVEWEERFTKLILLYNGLIARFNKYHEEYIVKQIGKEFGLQIRLSDGHGYTRFVWIKYVDVGRKDWMWYSEWLRKYKN